MVIKDNVSKIRSFTDLEFWQNARDLKINISSLVEHFPNTENIRLIDQLLSSSESVSSNLTACYGRIQYREKLQCSRPSRGSLYELKDHLIRSRDEKYKTTEVFTDMEHGTIRCLQIIIGYISYLQKVISNIEVQEPETEYGSMHYG